MSKLPPGLDNAINHSYLDALYERRSRRFPMGGEIDEGPLKYKSKHSPVPLSEIEEAILAWNGLGIKNINLSDFPPHKGLDLEVKFMSKTIPSLGDIHRTELFYTNDEGLYLLKLNDKDAPDLKGIEGLKREDKIDKILQLFRESRIKIHDGRAKIPDVPPGLAIHNTWSVNKPGTTLFMPVTDLSAGLINILFFYMREGHRFNFVDELNKMKPAGTQKWIDNGYIKKSNPIPLIEAELRFANGYIAEQPLFCQNVVLTQQILGLGGWMFSGFQSRHILGADESFDGLGFSCIESKAQGDEWGSAVSKAPVGLDGHFESFCPPYFKNMSEAVDAFNEMKWGNWDSKYMPYKDPSGVLNATPKPSKEEIQIVKDICNYIFDTYGNFPGFSDPMYCRMMVQNHHIDLDFYDKFYPEGAYAESHKNHFALWHPEIEDPFKK